MTPGLRFRHLRERKTDRCTLSRFALDFGGAAMDRGNAPDDCKPQAYPAGAARSRYVGPIEAFEDPGEMLRRDASSVIRDLDADRRLGIGKRSPLRTVAIFHDVSLGWKARYVRYG